MTLSRLLPRRPLLASACAIAVAGALFATFAVPVATAQPADAPLLALDDLKAGQVGEVWTVFQGEKPEPFSVEVTGVIRNVLGPGKSLILCRLTDPRVQHMGAVAGMSGSPLYIDGKLAGALSYQIQRFETVRYAGFTPVADLLEVQAMARNAKAPGSSGRPSQPNENPVLPPPANPPPTPIVEPRLAGGGTLQPLSPVFGFGGISPQVAAMFDGRFRALGLSVNALAGSTSAASLSAPAAAVNGGTAPASAGSGPTGGTFQLRPGQAVAAALSIGDVTLAGTGTVSHVDGNRILAFGHPMLSAGNVELPMLQADILAILPSNLTSFKVANTGGVIGTIREDRLSAIYGELGAGPALLPVTVQTPARTLHFSTVRHPRVTPMIIAAGVTQAVLSANEAGLTEGFTVHQVVKFAEGDLETTDIYPGAQGFDAGLSTLVGMLSSWVQNPVADFFPKEISVRIEPLDRNPYASLDSVLIHPARPRAGDVVTVTLVARDFQGAPVRTDVTFTAPLAWVGRPLEVVVANGPQFDILTGRPSSLTVSQVRSGAAYLAALRDRRPSDGVFVAVMERGEAFIDQTSLTIGYPSSIERIARGSDENRYQKQEVATPLHAEHVLAGRIIENVIRRPLTITE